MQAISMWSFFRAVMRELNAMLQLHAERDPKVLVVSVAGVQWTGRSTLVNTIFACRLRTLWGCCTRGVNIVLVPSTGSRTDCGDAADCNVLLDTERVCNPIFQHETWHTWHNNR